MDRLIMILFFLVSGLVATASDNRNDKNIIDYAGSAVRNTLKFNFDQVYMNEEVEKNFSDDFNLPKLRSFWSINNDELDFTLYERPGYLRLKSTKGSSLDIENTISQKIQNSIVGEAACYLELARLKEGSQTGLYVSEERINYIGVKKIGDRKYLISEINGNESKKVEIREDALMLRLNFDNEACWFEYSVDGLNFTQLGVNFQLEHRNGIEKYIGVFCYGNHQEVSEVDIDWFYFKPTNDISLQYADKVDK